MSVCATNVQVGGVNYANDSESAKADNKQRTIIVMLHPVATRMLRHQTPKHDIEQYCSIVSPGNLCIWGQRSQDRSQGTKALPAWVLALL